MLKQEFKNAVSLPNDQFTEKEIQFHKNLTPEEEELNESFIIPFIAKQTHTGTYHYVL